MALLVNRNSIRILGIIAGLLAGTAVALGLRGPSRHLVNHGEGSASSENIVLTADEEDEPDRRELVPDPGKRNELKRMVAEAKKEDAWLKEFALTDAAYVFATE